MNVLYLSYTGLAEPLGVSQVLSYIRGLIREGHRFTLITFEKPQDLADDRAMAELRGVCDEIGLRWVPLRYHRRPRLLATAWDLATFIATAWREAERGKIELVHARSYIPAFAALALNALRGIPFIFDMRALWPEELVGAGRLRAGSLAHRAVKLGERACLSRAAGVVSLTRAGLTHLRREHADGRPDPAWICIPTCVDLDRFRLAPPPADGALGCLGTVLSGWFRFDWLTAFFRAAARTRPTAPLRIISRDDPVRIGRLAAEARVPEERLSVFSCTSAEAPKAIADLSAAAMFFETGIAKLGSCPTRMGEALACGRPVVANAGVGDVAEIIRDYRVGVVVDENSEAAMAAAMGELEALLADPDLPARCRRAAEEWFSLDRGVAAYAGLYRRAAAPQAQTQR